MLEHEEVVKEAYDAATKECGRNNATDIQSFVIGWLSSALAHTMRELERERAKPRSGRPSREK
jgi:hypothetical protein